mgnify:FL=1
MKQIITKFDDETGDFDVVTPIPFTLNDGIEVLGMMVANIPKYEDTETYNVFDLIRENKELKKQLKEYEHHLKISKEMLDLQRQDGNYNYDNYMLGLYNGMEYIMSLFEVREPIFKDGKNIKFLNDKNQQKEFIEWLEEKIKNYELPLTDENKKALGYTLPMKGLYKEVLEKYKELIGDNNVKDIA